MKIVGFLIRTLVFIFLFFNLVAAAEPEKSGEVSNIESEIRGVISDQIDAFSKFDVERAYSHASKAIKSIFPSAKIFGSMVRQSYPMIWAPKEYHFLKAEVTAGGVIQRVIFTDEKENLHLFDYLMLPNELGNWAINGVIPVMGEKGA
ncbi:MAG: DUF4864 domain-containing protein [Pseudomonadota bacterium]|nr:DUF4864 domain-containing protein [Pseudomonadota bacterium]